jgi:hypothetical protein
MTARDEHPVLQIDGGIAELSVDHYAAMCDDIDTLRDLNATMVAALNAAAEVTMRQRALQSRCAAWREAKYPDSTKFSVGMKFFEEAGEFARAVVGDVEHRPGRGDVHQEAAQSILVLLSLIGMFYPYRDLLDTVWAELERHEADLAAGL